MNKAAAAKYLGVSTRTLERYTSESRLSPGRVRTRTGPALDYDPADLDALRAELEAPTDLTPEAPPEGPTTAPTRVAEGPTEGAASLARVEPQVLAEHPQAGAGAVLVPVEALASLAAVLVEAGAQATERPHVATADKLLLDLEEAQALTGLSRGHLRAAIAAGELHAKRMGRAWRMRRGDLEKYLLEAFK